MVTALKPRKSITLALQHARVNILMESMRAETLAIRKFRTIITDGPLPVDDDALSKLTRVIPGTLYLMKNGVRKFASYNGIIMLEINNLTGMDEVENMKAIVADLPQTYAAFTGVSQKSLKVWVRFICPDGSLPQDEDLAQIYHANAYRLAVKYYQPQLPFNISLREPLLDLSCCKSADEHLYFNANAMPVVMKQPLKMPDVIPLKIKVDDNRPRLERMAPGYEKFHAVSLIFEAALRKAAASFEGSKYASEEERNKGLMIRTAEECFKAGLRIYYDMKLCKGVNMQWFAGMKNLLNSFQDDFDKGIDRDPAYIYGPALPRTLYVGFKIGSL